ncbi:uncharacterized protein LOC131015711 [Salvia miltiorrhiza]|uniref:uncharacterized protein LOC131015711 n=1 Tax=Salvia miltiorrhiza TaxID=226208 RepID=UPI0025AB71D6|nr:uncharacterized protein LOC131015711 [Salvia miltiorrhiza]
MTGSDPAYNVAAADDILPPLSVEKRQQRKKNKSGAFGIFRAALYMLRKRTDEKEAAAATKKEKSGGGDWKKIVESMRPLHVQEIPASPTHAAWPAGDMFGAASPAPSCSSSSGTMSQYASATNLRDLCNDDEEEERNPDEVFDAIEGDEMIDAKAEEFIAQFYRSIDHQNSIHRQNRGL